MPDRHTETQRYLIYHRRLSDAGILTESLAIAVYGDWDAAVRMARLSRVADADVVLYRETVRTTTALQTTMAAKPAPKDKNT